MCPEETRPAKCQSKLKRLFCRGGSWKVIGCHFLRGATVSMCSAVCLPVLCVSLCHCWEGGRSEAWNDDVCASLFVSQKHILLPVTAKITQDRITQFRFRFIVLDFSWLYICLMQTFCFQSVTGCCKLDADPEFSLRNSRRRLGSEQNHFSVCLYVLVTSSWMNWIEGEC